MTYQNLRLASGNEIEIQGSINDVKQALRNHSEFNYLADKVTSEYISGGGCEVALPPLEIGSDLTNQYMTRLYSFLESYGRINKDCGHHVHIGLRPINISEQDFFNNSIEKFKLQRNYYFQCTTELLQFETIKDVVLRYCLHQEFINSMLPKSRRNNRFCRPINIDTCYDNIKASTNINGIQRAIKHDSKPHYDNTNDKFYAVNLLPYTPKNTIEFRQHGGTINAEKIINFSLTLKNFINYSHNKRVKVVNQGELVNQPLTNIFRPRTKLFKAFNLLQTEQGCTTRDLMTECNIEDARSVRRTINTLRTRLGSPKAVTCLTQEFYGYRNGESNGLYDLNGYKIPTHVDVRSQGETVIDYDVDSHLFADLDESVKQYMINRIETLR